MASMTFARWLFVILFYVAADLASPLAGVSTEALDGEAEEAIQLAGRARVRRAAEPRRAPTGEETRARHQRPGPVPAVATVSVHAGPARKIPSPVPEPAPEDH
jgi:hypothetical protein